MAANLKGVREPTTKYKQLSSAKMTEGRLREFSRSKGTDILPKEK